MLLASNLTFTIKILSQNKGLSLILEPAAATPTKRKQFTIPARLECACQSSS